MKITNIIAGTAITVAALAMQPAQAHADPVSDQIHDAVLVCHMLDNEPTLLGVTHIALNMFAHGLTPDQAADTLQLAVTSFCPGYADLAARWADLAAAGHTPGLSNSVGSYT